MPERHFTIRRIVYKKKSGGILKAVCRWSITLILKTVNAKKWMVSFTQSKFDAETEAHRKIDNYPHTEHPDNQLKLLIF